MKRTPIFIFILISGLFNLYFFLHSLPRSSKKPSLIEQIKPRPLDKYTIENLSKQEIPKANIQIESTLKEEDNYTTSLFTFSFDPTLSAKEKKKVSGLINIPKQKGQLPLVVMFRGYVDQKVYKTGTGTQRAGEYFADNGFITVAPDFLGYGESDPEAESIFESRFQTYVTALTLLKSLNSISNWDTKNLFIWAHSNGGQIALTTLEVTGQPIPSTLWAPVSKPFPYSILYYTDESDDRGKLIRKELAKFEQSYDPDLYAIDLYFDRITAPIQLHQGTNDDAVPVNWSDALSKNLKTLNKDVTYYKYNEADHNLNPSWNLVVSRDLKFFEKHLTIAP